MVVILIEINYKHIINKCSIENIIEYSHPEMGNNVKLSDLNEFISCPLCHGYLIDATTVNECLHTFCKSCIVKHIKNNHNECPKCNTVIHERRPLDYIIHDRNKQDIVYKLVPQLYILEMNSRLAARETRGIDSMTKSVLEKKFIHIVLVQRKKCFSKLSTPLIKPHNPTSIYLKCPITIKIRHIRKLLSVKFQLSVDDRITLLHRGDIVSDDDQISNLAQSLTFCIQYEVSRISQSIKLENESEDNKQESQVVAF